MAEAILYGSYKLEDDKYDWNAAFNNQDFINYITSIPILIDYIGYDLFISDSEYASRIDFGTATFPSCSGYIGSHAFDGCKNMTKVSFLNSYSNPNDIKYIGEYAFVNCKNLSSVYVNVARHISEYAFTMLYNLKSFTMNSIYYSDADLVKTYIGSHAFEMCTNSSLSVSINTVKEIGDYAFANCIGMRYANVGNFMCNKVCYRAFNNCTSLSSIYINTYGYYSSNYSNNKLIIEDEAFMGCDSLSSVSVCNLKSIGKRAFKNLSNLQYFSNNVQYTESSKSTIIEYLPYIDEEAFANCVKLNTSYYCLSYIDTICESAFYGCTSLTSNPGSHICRNVSKNAFYGCNSLSYMSLNDYGYRLLSTAGISIVCKLDRSAFNGVPNLNYINITNLESIDSYMFTGMSKLSDVQINSIDMYTLSTYVYPPDLQINIGSHAFENCSNLQEIYLYLIDEIGDYAFAECSKLSYAILGSSLCNKIGKSAFKNCSAIKYLAFNYSGGLYGSANYLYVDDYAFENCLSLSTLSLIGTSYIGNNILKGCVNLSSIFIQSPYNNLSIPDNIFSDCLNLQSITIMGLSKVTTGLFSNCSNLFTIDNLLNCSFIESNAFYGKQSLYSINIGMAVSDGVYVDDYAFYNCSSLYNINMPFKYIGSNAFYNCSSLAHITGMTLSNVDIGEYAFYGCSNLNMITVGGRDIGSHAFENCVNFSYFNGPGCCRSIGAYAFKGCASINFYSVFYNGSSTLEYIGSHAFEGLQNLKYIRLDYIQSVTVLESIDAFSGIASDYIITIPSSLYSYFISDSVWGLISDHILTV